MEVESILFNPGVYDAEMLAQLNEIRPDMLPPLLPGHEAVVFALGYAVLFVAIAWLAFRRRDL